MHNLDKADAVTSVYRRILMREPDRKGLESYVESSLSVQEIAQVLMKSKEYQERIQPVRRAITGSPGKRILLFGAYGNGNLGDLIQPSFLRRQILGLYPDAQVWAASCLPHYYPYLSSRKAPSWLIKNPDLLRDFDAILIGGGGLLSHPHEPLLDADWANEVSTPIIILAVGATSDTVQKAKALVKKARYVSARDVVSFRALSSIRPDVVLMRDPVLCDLTYPEFPLSEAGERSWVLRGPISDIHPNIKNFMGRNDRVICFEPNVDKSLEELFPRLTYTPTAESFMFQIKDSSCVVSMRYHGAIMALRMGKKVYGLGDQKIESLLSELGAGRFFIRNVEDIRDKHEGFDWHVVNQNLKAWIDDYGRKLEEILAGVLDPATHQRTR